MSGRVTASGETTLSKLLLPPSKKVSALTKKNSPPRGKFFRERADSFSEGVDSIQKVALEQESKEEVKVCLKHVHTVEPQWLEHLWDRGNSFETWVVRAT